MQPSLSQSSFVMSLISLLLLPVTWGQSLYGGVHPAMGGDGKQYYVTPLYCTITGFYNVAYYNKYRSTFTERTDMTCCYMASTRNNCCLGNKYEKGLLYRVCRCHPSIGCGLEQTTTTPLTTTTTTTPETTTTTPETTTTTPETTTTTPETTTTTPETTTTTPETTTTTPETTTTTPETTTTTPETTTTTPETTTTTPVTTTTTPETTTTTPETTTTTPETTTTTPETTTTTPETTTTTPETTTTTPETTTTTLSTTTSSPLSLCQPQFRLLNGKHVSDECTYKGVTKLITLHASNLPDGMQFCTAVYVTAPVNGVVRQTFLTHQFCKFVIKAVLDTGRTDFAYELEIGDQRYPITFDLFQLVDGEDGNAFITVYERYANILRDLGVCQTTACPYNSAFMDGLVNFTDCRVVGYGPVDTSLTKNGLNEDDVYLNPDGCATLPDTYNTNNTLCFTATSGLPIRCGSHDTGSPVYCRAPSNGEDILMGITAEDNTCGQHTDIKVVPFPTS